MKILFVNPSRSGQGNIPLNLPLLVAIVKKAGHAVALFDFSDYAHFEAGKDSYESMFFKPAPLDETAVRADRQSFYGSSFGSNVCGMGLKESDYVSDFNSLVSDFRPDVVAVSSLSIDFDFITEFLKPFKAKYRFTLVCGGVHSILRTPDVAQADVYDHICIGEGENAFPSLLDALSVKTGVESVEGFWHRSQEGVTKSNCAQLTDISTIPPQDFDLFDPIHFYRPFDGTRYKMLNYEFSRGCPYSCTYCVNGVLKERYKGLGPYHRVKDVAQAIDEMRYLIDRYRFDFIRFWDEDFASIRIETLRHLAEEYAKEIQLPFLVYARVDTLSEEKVKILKKMGCRTVAMGIESGNEGIRKEVMNRHMTNERIQRAFTMVKSYGIRVSAYNIIGVPGETRDTIFDTIKLNKDSAPDSFSVTLLEPYKGTPIWELCEKHGLASDHKTTCNEVQFIPQGMTRGELEGLFRTFRFYVKFPENRYSEIRMAETSDDAYSTLSREYVETMSR